MKPKTKSATKTKSNKATKSAKKQPKTVKKITIQNLDARISKIEKMIGSFNTTSPASLQKTLTSLAEIRPAQASNQPVFDGSIDSIMSIGKDLIQ